MVAVNWERLARAAGAGFVVLAIAAFIVGGEVPKVGDSTEDLISYYDGDRGQVLVSSLLFAFALLLFLWFAAAIATTLRESGEGRVGATVIAGATAFVSLQLALTGMAASLAYSVAGGGDTGVIKALFDLQWVLDMFAALPAAVFVLSSSVGFMRTRAVPAWLCWDRPRSGSALSAPHDELGAGWLLVAYPRVHLHPHPSRDALDPRDEHHPGSRSRLQF